MATWRSSATRGSSRFRSWHCVVRAGDSNPRLVADTPAAARRWEGECDRRRGSGCGSRGSRSRWCEVFAQVRGSSSRDNGVVLVIIGVGGAVVIRDVLAVELPSRSGSRPPAMGGERPPGGEPGAIKSKSARGCWGHGWSAAHRCWLHGAAVRGRCAAHRFLGHIDGIGLLCFGSVCYLGG